MNAIIKRHTLGRQNAEAEYFIDPDKIEIDRSSRSENISPARRAANLVAQANEEAAEIVKQAQREAIGIRTAAHQEGYEEGYKELEQARSAVAQRIQEIEAELSQQVEQGWADLEPEVLKLSIDIAKKIVQREIGEREDFVIETVKTALRQLRERHDLKILVSPTDYGLMRERREDILCACDGSRNVEIIEDRRIGGGGCMIETPAGHLDARIETQMLEVERAMTEAAHDDSSDQIAA